MNLRRAPYYVLGSLVVGGFLGLLDFAVFSLGVDHLQVVESVLYKSRFWSLSLFASQILWYSCLGVLALFACAVFWRIVRTRMPICQPEGWALPVVAAVLAVGTGVLRFFGGSARAPGLVVFFLVAALVVVGLIVAGRRRRADSGDDPDVSVPQRLMTGVAALSMVLSLSFFLPDLYSGFSQLQRRGVGVQVESPNVLIVVLDTLRADHLSCYGYQRNKTPRIDRISMESVRFANAFAPAPWTLPSHASMFTGLFPSQHQVEWARPTLDESFVTLAERLAVRGYQTVGMTENPFTARSHGLAQGFAEYHEMWRKPLVARAVRKMARKADLYRETFEYSEKTVGRFHRWVRNNKGRGEPFFAFINLMAAHLPNYPSPGHCPASVSKVDLERIEPINQVPERFYLPQYHLSPRELGIMEDFYDGEVSLLDRRIGEISALLEQEGVMEDTILILTSDHGENFGDHGLIEHQFCLYNSLLHVPLIIRYPSGLDPSTEVGPVSTASLFSAILRLVEVSGDDSRDDFQEALLSGMKGPSSVVSELGDSGDMLRNLLLKDAPNFDFAPFDRQMKSLVAGCWKYVWCSDGAHELYNLESDFREEDNLIGIEEPIAARLAEALAQWEESVVRRDLDGMTGDVDEETRDALRALGYE